MIDIAAHLLGHSSGCRILSMGVEGAAILKLVQRGSFHNQGQDARRKELRCSRIDGRFTCLLREFGRFVVLLPSALED